MCPPGSGTTPATGIDVKPLWLSLTHSKPVPQKKNSSGLAGLPCPSPGGSKEQRKRFQHFPLHDNVQGSQKDTHQLQKANPVHKKPIALAYSREESSTLIQRARIFA
jgi:hypothetical protein